MGKLRNFLNYRMDISMFGLEMCAPPNWFMIILFGIGILGLIGIMLLES